ncbi:hypothetical protein PPERSA_03514 [Pseudocohnilembus persalinus]|uniref:Uncharacterized protein n=1 Tax=Pseudocohnilembus persalinus TaxID=266149 RepID=A0A0V0R289_PSEPJ|nr:hypothetical protein PPERSA_03514 [Pseudocohnilembus persalinus]|eukprot:KRX08643.1 hypothetical protein PPERSA_03514 [Pseudocohnilembus persalinus]
MELINVLFLVTLLISIVYMGIIAFEKVGKDNKIKKYFSKKTKLDQINDKYEQLRSQRRDLVHHYYWAQSNGERQKEQNMKQEIFRVDDELAQLREQYNLTNQGKSYPLQKI